ncbi:GNAT family N-acetyltransferase [bacterium]|nr:GNAT family N-acetyltransferase [bacterium]
MITISELTYADRSIFTAITELLQQLTGKPTSITIDDLEKIISTKNTLLYTAIDEEDNNTIVGMISLVFIRKLTGFSVRVEDVVVHNNARKRGIGKQLMLHTIQVAESKGVHTIDLTSHSSRKEANNLYLSLGFEQHETNVYRLKINPK